MNDDRWETNEPIPGSVSNTFLLSLALGAAYWMAGKLAIAMAVQNGDSTSVAFFPEGLSLVFVIFFGARVWTGIFLGQFLLSMESGAPVGISLFTALCCSLTGVLGGFLFRRLGISKSLKQPGDVVLLFVLCALVLQPLSASATILARHWMGGIAPGEIQEAWFYRWAGNVMGQFLLVPIFLAWTGKGTGREDARFFGPLLIVCVYLLLFLPLIYGNWGAGDPLLRLLFFSAFYLVLVGVALQTGVKTVSVANLIMAVPFLYLIDNDPVLLESFALPKRLLCVDIFIIAAILTSLLISSLWEQLMDRIRQLREANAIKEKLFSIVSHDLQVPVFQLKASLDRAERESFNSDQFKGCHRELDRGVEHIEKILQNVMEWGNFQGQLFQPAWSEVNLHKCAEEVLELMAPMAGQKDIKMQNRIPEAAWVRADLHQVHAIMRNLLSNALKFTQQGGEVLLSASYGECCWHCSVVDNGVGMPPEKTSRLFKSDGAYHSTSGTEGERGLGLGLQICRDFIRANRGRISVESEPGSGTVFHFTLPDTGPSRFS